MFSIPIFIAETRGFERRAELISVGIPMPRGLVTEAEDLALLDGESMVPAQFRILARWPDGSIKWLLMEALVSVAAYGTTSMSVRSAVANAAAPTALSLSEVDGAFNIATGACSFEVPSRGDKLLGQVALCGSVVPVASAAILQLTDPSGRVYHSRTTEAEVEALGPVTATVRIAGDLRDGQSDPLRFTARMIFCADSTAVRMALTLRNPRAALHCGGLWDLGDPGSSVFKDVSVKILAAEAVEETGWSGRVDESEQLVRGEDIVVYQDSSGGERWNSRNHIDARGASTVSFRGYQVRGSGGQVRSSGDRATPCLRSVTKQGWMAATVDEFWQNFPKAVRCDARGLGLGVFPHESRSIYELQGGEQKTHTLFLEFGSNEESSRIRLSHAPMAVHVDAQWIEHSRAVPYFVAASTGDDSTLAQYLQSIVEGKHAWHGKREVIDEYGWRNYGDVYADHEAVRCTGAEPLISHYNNQYDFVYGAALNFLRTADHRWGDLMAAAARHVIDIDIYHTDQDRAVFNGGLFWHTDHYQDAATCTHRTYSRRNGSAGYGGGPSNEHNYTSGLLLYFYLTGDTNARSSVIGLADWVIAMDDGARTVFALIDSGATGQASKTVSADFHGPGRGAGNSINALLDAYEVSGHRQYMAKAEELIYRCIHPKDDIQALQLSEPEHRWSYLVFLQVLGKYLSCKIELGETDYAFFYARDSLLHYAAWMLQHETPYKDVLHKVELPTETWPAQDIRKVHVFHLAARCVQGEFRARLSERAAFFFERCLGDLLSFETAYLTRPQVLLAVYGPVHGYFRRTTTRSSTMEAGYSATHTYSFGAPQNFVPQRLRLKDSLMSRTRIVVAHLRRMMREKMADFHRRVSRD